MTYAYNSQGAPSAGLAGEYFNDPGATRDFTAKVASVLRIDPQVDFEWGQGSPNPAIAADNFLARWTGTLTAPAGIYNFGTISDDAARVWIDGVKVIDNWPNPAGATTTPVYGIASNLNGGPVPIVVEYYEATDAASVSLWQSGPGTASPVPAAWLSTAPPALPVGWSLSPDPGGDLAYTSARIGARSVTLMDSSGATHPFTWKGTAWAAPAGEDTILTNDAGLGTLVATVPGGGTYAFNANGTLASVASPAASITPGVDGRRSIIRYTWSGSPTRLASITDQVSNRSIILSYGSPCPANLLCTVDLSAFGAGVEQLSYVANHLSAIVDRGGARTTFGYDTSGRLSTVADVLTKDLVNPVPAERMTAIAYNSDAKAALVTPPAAAAGAPRAKRSYTYTPAAAPASVTTSVRVGDVPATPLLVRTVTLDGVGRLAEDRNGAGEATTYDWGTGDLLRKRTDALGRVSTTVYDSAGRPTDTYGPGLAGEFSGYTSTSAPHARVAYDEAMVGLGATYFSNKFLAGDPVGVGTGVGNPTGALDQDWSAGAPAPVPTASGGDNWSARFTGDIDLPYTGTGANADVYKFRVASSDGARVFIDDTRVVDAWYDHDGTSAPGDFAVAAPPPNPTNPLTSSRHRIRVELYEATGNASVRLEWSPPAAGGVFSVVPGASLFPRYGLATKTTDADNKVFATEYADAAQGLGPEHGLATATVVDPSGAAPLRSTTAYQTTSTGYRRPASRTLPKGAATALTYAYYGDSEMVDNPCTTGADLANQAGAVRSSTGADPAGPQGRIAHESVYDGAGRVVATRVATDATWSCTTFDARSRPTSTVDSAGKRTDLSYATPGQVSTSGPDSAGTLRTTVAAVDWAGRPASYTDEAGTTTTTAYDAYGRPQRTLRAFAGGGAATVLTEVALYDAASRVKTFKDYASGAARTHSFDYFADGALKTTTRANAVVTTATNDNNRGWVKALSNVGPLGEMSPWTYARSPAARVTTETTTNRSRVFAYDGAGRLATTTEGATVRPYAYDANSSRCSITQATCDGSWAYDDADRL